MSTARRLIVMRHAKSDWHTDATHDHARPLNDRGRRDAPRMAEELVRLEWTPDTVLCSDATRARQTWDLMRPVIGAAVPVESMPELYHAGSGALRRAVSQLPPEMRTVLAIGHNPGWEEVVAWLCGEPTVMPTTACALLETTADGWPEAVAEPRRWMLRDVLRPKEL
jgi:phosphohistidine phosphatase